MIPLEPNRTYKITYADGTTYSKGATVYFQTLDTVPLAKHLIKVMDIETGKVINLVELLAHPWDNLVEFNGTVPSPTDGKKSSPLLSLLQLFSLRTVTHEFCLHGT